MVRYITIASFVLVLVGYLFGGGFEKQTAQSMMQIERDSQTWLGRIHDQVAADAVRQYEIANRHGTKIDQCVHAGLVAAAYIQAKDENNYRLWKSREDSDCRRAGVPR